MRRHGLAALALYVAGAAAAATQGNGNAAPRIDTMAQRMQACTACHGKEGRAAADGYYPRIAGKPAGYLYNQLLNLRDGRRHYALMSELLQPLSDDYLREIAEYFAALELPYPPPARAEPRADAQRAQQLATRGDEGAGILACSSCHGKALTGRAPQIPGLLGLPRDYLNGQLGAWRSGERRAQAPDCMAKIARALSPEDLNALTHWLAAQPLPSDPRATREAPAAWPQPCGGVPASLQRPIPTPAASAAASTAASTTPSADAASPATPRRGAPR